jgi:hypothetical protein
MEFASPRHKQCPIAAELVATYANHTALLFALCYADTVHPQRQLFSDAADPFYSDSYNYINMNGHHASSPARAHNRPSQTLPDYSNGMSYLSPTAPSTHSHTASDSTVAAAAAAAAAADTVGDQDTDTAWNDIDQQQQQHTNAADDIADCATVTTAPMGDTQQLVRDEHDAAASTTAHEAEHAGKSSSSRSSSGSSSSNSGSSSVDDNTPEQTAAVVDSASVVAAQHNVSTATGTAAADSATAAQQWADIVPTNNAVQQQQQQQHQQQLQWQQQQQQQQQRRQQQYSSGRSVKLDFHLASQNPCLYTHDHCDLTPSSDLFASWKTAYRGAVRDEIDDWWHDRLLLNSTATAATTTATSSSSSGGGADGEQTQAQLLFGDAAAVDGYADDGFTADSYMYDLMPSSRWASSPSTLQQHKVSL